MAEEMISKEQMDYTIDVLIAMVVEELAEDLHEEPNKVLYDFLQSKIGKALFR